MKFKKIIGIMAICAAPVLMTGCGNKNTLTCLQEESVSSMEIVAVFKNEEVEKVNIKAEFDFSDVNDVQFETSKEQDFCSSFNTSFNGALKDCKQSVEGKLIVINSEIDLSKFGELSGKIEEAKQSFEKQGFKCKIK